MTPNPGLRPLGTRNRACPTYKECAALPVSSQRNQATNPLSPRMAGGGTRGSVGILSPSGLQLHPSCFILHSLSRDDLSQTQSPSDSRFLGVRRAQEP